MKTLDKILIGALCAFVVLCLLSFLPGTPSASSIGEPIEGQHYTDISKTPIVQDKAVMIFWYGCPHCRKTYEIMGRTGFEESLANAGVKLRRIPVVANSTWELHARLYYALEMAGFSSQGHKQVMDLIQDLRATKREDLIKVLNTALTDESERNPDFHETTDEIMKVLDSSEVDNRLKQDQQIVEKARIQGVPTMLVNGESEITLGNGVTYIDFPAIALKLITGEKK